MNKNSSSPSYHHISLLAKRYREQSEEFSQWASGYGVITHSDETQVRIQQLAEELVTQRRVADVNSVIDLFRATDLIANAGMWLVAHMTYAQNVFLDGRALSAHDFKTSPEGHMGGALNMVPAYSGYLLANALTGKTRSWLMGQGHCVAAIDALNVIVNNMSAAHAARYELNDAGLSRLARDFYSYTITPEGMPESPVGSHVNAHTAGGIQEGGYLGFAELYYPHMPLPGEELVVFLSDGAFEEQRGSDWAPRWWRPADSGSVIPIMIANGRRIDQRTTMSQQGGVSWFNDHLELNNFAPYKINGRDPAEFTWAILTCAEQLDACAKAAAAGLAEFPINMPYAIAETEKGFGFPGAGKNAAHNLPLPANPATDPTTLTLFNEGVKSLWVSKNEIGRAVEMLCQHESQQRPRERDHSLAKICINNVVYPEPLWNEISTNSIVMSGIDDYFCQIVQANPNLRPRVGNPDELRSNRMGKTLDLLKHRVTAPENGIAEDLHGKVITALNEESIICAALGNKRGINIAVSYEAFAVKMLGALRQEIVFSRHQKEANRPAGWLSVPIVLTSHTWENGKNEQSHQDPSLCEVLMNEMSDMSRVLFPADYNSASASLKECYQSRGGIWALVVPKRELPTVFTNVQSEELIANGASRVTTAQKAKVQIVAIGGYQLREAQRATKRLSERGVATEVIYLIEPGKYRKPRDRFETEHVTSEEVRNEIFPDNIAARVFVCHCRPETLLGVVRPLDGGRHTTSALGYINRGGTLDVFGMLFANHCTWAHIIAEVCSLLRIDCQQILEGNEISALRGDGDPYALA